PERFTIANPWTAMLIAASFVLIIGCANIANLLLARGARRANEFAIRRAIGATRWQLVRQLLIEHAIIAASAGAIGFVVGLAGVLARTLAAVSRVEAVFDTADVVFASIDLPPERFKTGQERLVLYRQLDDRLAASPDVDAATLASTPPFYDAPLRTVEIDGR